MDATRKRRSRDEERRTWYSRQRTRRFARRLGFPAAEAKPAQSMDWPVNQPSRGTDGEPFPTKLPGTLWREETRA